MDDRPDNNHNDPQKASFALFLLKRSLLALVLIAAVLYALVVGVEYLQKSKFVPESAKKDPTPPKLVSQILETAAVPTRFAAQLPQELQQPSHGETGAPTVSMLDTLEKAKAAPGSGPAPGPPKVSNAPAPFKPSDHSGPSDAHPGGDDSAARQRHSTIPAAANYRAVGVAFAEAVMKPIDYELNHRLWGWRPNDIINLTDNVNQHQLGVLEVTRRTVVQLAERISRTGYNDSFDRDLENAMNWLMIKATSYWFPSPETKYKESLAELENYKRNLIKKEAFFYTRTDNLIPLLAAYEDLLGSCDQNLVKTKESDGSKIGFTKADNYFYYAKGVSSAMATILEAVSLDFAPVMSNRNASELLHHAIASCRLASSLEPWIITNGSLDGILANHRAHMAAPISHARFYLGQLIKTLST